MIELTQEERRAVRSLQRLARKWPRSLMLFCGGCGLTVRKPEPGKFYGDEYTIASISGVPCDGGDGGREHCSDDVNSIRHKGLDQ
jgi:hypothetical protein